MADQTTPELTTRDVLSQVDGRIDLVETDYPQDRLQNRHPRRQDRCAFPSPDDDDSYCGRSTGGVRRCSCSLSSGASRFAKLAPLSWVSAWTTMAVMSQSLKNEHPQQRTAAGILTARCR